MLKKIINFLFLIVLSFFIILNLGLPFIFDIVLLTGFIFLYIKNIKLFIVYNLSILICIILTSIFYYPNYLNKNNNFLGHKRFIKDDKYLTNINQKINVPPGDLIHLDTCNNNNSYVTNKKQLFITDELGFRNKKFQLKESHYVLIGNSIILSSRLDQTKILSELLNNNYKDKIFSNLSFSGIGPQTYEKNIMDHLKFFKAGVKLYIFYFEGNDFWVKNKKNEYYWYGHKIPEFKYKLRFGYERLERNKDKIFNYTFLKRNYFYKIIRPHSQRFYKKFLSKWTNSCLVDWRKINNSTLGFLYKDFQVNDYITHIIKDKNILSKIDKIFFIPTKLSTYENFFNDKFSKINRDKKINFLKKNYEPLNVKVIDLTNILQINAKKFLKNNKLLYFPDDTHLNQLGNEVIANYIIKNLI